MTRRTNRRGPGTILLRLSRLLLSDHLLSTVVHPTIADLQREVADASNNGAQQWRARWRGYRAFWTVALVAAFPRAVRFAAMAATVVMLLDLVRPVLGWATMLAVPSVVVAVLIHSWYARHPSQLPTPDVPQTRLLQINFSSMEVAGNVGGLIFVVGSVFIVLIGVPSLIWFLLGVTAAGSMLAWHLIAWHTNHPHYRIPAARLYWR